MGVVGNVKTMTDWSAARQATLDPRDVGLLRANFRQILRRHPPALRSNAMALYERIEHDHWAVEWNLARWLGEILGVEKVKQQALMKASVFGLAYVRLRDDRQDGELEQGDEGLAAKLEEILYQNAIEPFNDLCGNHDEFWKSFERLMSCWKLANGRDMFQVDVNALGTREVLDLGDIGAPLLTVVAASHALQTIDLALDDLYRPVRSYLAAAVLFDHCNDWRTDLSAARPNLFVRAMLRFDYRELKYQEAESKMQLALLDLARVEAYIELVRGLLVRAADEAWDLGLGAFAKHMNFLEREARRSGEQAVRKFERLMTVTPAAFRPMQVKPIKSPKEDLAHG